MIEQAGGTALMFSEGCEQIQSSMRPWKILIADDEPDVHLVTRLALQRKVIFGRGIEFISAYSGEETRRILAADSEIACILLDVVMETDSSGLDVVRFIRGELGNTGVRIILRTGQPGQAPESDVILKYEINDYKQKTELSAEKLFSTVVTAIRSYRDIRTIEQSRKGMEMIIDASADMLKAKSLQLFADGVLNQLICLLHISWDACYIRSDAASASGFTARSGGTGLTVLAGAGRFSGLEDSVFPAGLDRRQVELIDRALDSGENVYEDGAFAIVLKDRESVQGILYLEDCPPVCEIDLDLISIFCANVSDAFANILLHEELGKKVEERTRELKDAQARLLKQEKLASIGQLAAGIAHEINNPMSFIISNLSMLRNRLGKLTGILGEAGGGSSSLLDDTQVMVDESLAGANRVRRIVQDLRVFSAVDLPRGASTDLNRSVQATVDVLGVALRSKAEVRVDLGEDLDLPVSCDPASLNLAISSLLLNAAQAIEGRGRIGVRTWREGSVARVSVEDSGVGMTAETMGRIFEPFFTTKEVGRGIGLGLTVALETLRGFGGDISVESEPGRGSRFTLSLPY